MYEDEDERKSDDRGGGWMRGDSPGETSKKHEKGEEVGEGGIGTVPCVLCL